MQPYSDYDMSRSNHMRGYDASAYSSRGYQSQRIGGYPTSRTTYRTEPAPQQVARTEQPQTSRRRIPVACGRCRKRKIRCSGDPGDQSGCANCKNANIKQGECVFLRVGSECVTTPLSDMGGQYGDHSPHILSAPPQASYYQGSLSSSGPPMQRMGQMVSPNNMMNYMPVKSVQNIYSDEQSRHGMYPSYSRDSLASDIPVSGSTSESTPKYLLPGEQSTSMAPAVLPSQPILDTIQRPSPSQMRSGDNYYANYPVDPATTMSPHSISHMAPRTAVSTDYTYGFPALQSLQSSSLTSSGAERSNDRAFVLPSLQSRSTASSAPNGMQGGYGHLLNDGSSSNYWSGDNSTNLYMQNPTPKIEPVSSSMSTPAQSTYLSPVTSQPSSSSHLSSYPGTASHYDTSPTETNYGNEGAHHGSSGSSPVSTSHSSNSSISSPHYNGVGTDSDTDSKAVKPESRASPAHSYTSRTGSEAGVPGSMIIPSASNF
ncbi:hypothetical protein BJ508DRAFT_310940 [Ascobolus immersus RN42]|uniref:Zn(2)-C6 fungal-type domain-containing protein n=1 Tax=Ascobolus immersus RN42 TaxID=1160509 RepID=A0A3N4HXP6_ASCIM|nr:hypothetical protein BJ508DRAFT_310940 [Ascobolus immersus RN42]